MPKSSRSFVKGSASLLDAMANEKRLLILDILAKREMSVGALSEMVGLSQSALSQHLGKLRGAHLVRTRREAQTVYYSCDNPSVSKVLGLLAEIFGKYAAPADAAHDRGAFSAASSSHGSRR